ncbi:MAG: glycosyltransferase family 9 protein [Bryobacterales bacterium]|nr:glycosyltransferase family 9 protein [Bryobacterales bacterium]
MPSVIDQLPPGSRVALIRLRSMGDCVLTTPAIHLLKQYRPDLRIAVVVEDRFRDVYAGNPDLEVLLQPSRNALLGWRPRLALNLHGGPRSTWMTALSLARFRAGFAHFPFAAVYNICIPRAQQILGEERTVHTAEHVASAMFHLGVPRTPIPRARLFTTPVDRGTPYCILHPQATAPEKIWPASRFLELAARIRDEFGLEPVFLGANDAELAPFRTFTCVSGVPLREAISWISGASLFVGNDSGPAHVAAAFARPGVVLFGGSDPVIWAPWHAPELRQIVHSPVAEIRVAEVFAALRTQFVPAGEFSR